MTRENTKRQSNWSPDQIAISLNLKGQGLSAKAVADVLGRSEASVLGQWQRNAIPKDSTMLAFRKLEDGTMLPLAEAEALLHASRANTEVIKGPQPIPKYVKPGTKVYVVPGAAEQNRAIDQMRARQKQLPPGWGRGY